MTRPRNTIKIVNATDFCCPFCGLLCDDLAGGDEPTSLAVCARAAAAYPAAEGGAARAGGRPCDTAEAVRAAAAVLTRARRPLVGGLACDVAGQRKALDLAERVGGVLDHMNGAAMFRNWLAMQDGGWMTTTLSEVRNRADVVLFVGSGPDRFPRLRERCLADGGMFGALDRRVLVVGPRTDGVPEPDLAVPLDRIGELMAAMRARLNGARLDSGSVAGVPLARIDDLLATMQGAAYGVLAWNAAELDFPGADLAVRAIADLINALNRSTRWSGLPLGGNDGDASAAQVCTWRTGYPSRVAFDTAGPHYQPTLYAADRLLARREVDALVWISAFDAGRVPPPADCPVIVLGRADMRPAVEPEVFIPVAVPGVDSDGMLHRMDGVVALPLHARRGSTLPTVADTLAAIIEEINHAAA